MAPGPAAPRRRLDSWKDVADYLSRDVSTVMRWARTDGLPVHHIGGSRHRAVFAWTDEIDEWFSAQTASERPDPDRTATELSTRTEPTPNVAGSGRQRILDWAGGAAIVLLLLTLWWLWPSRPESPGRGIAKAVVIDATLVALDGKGGERWRFDIPANGRSVRAPQIRIADVDGDDRADVVAAITLVKPAGDGAGAVMLLDADGKLRWTQTLDDRYTFGTSEYGPGWYPDDVLVFDVAGDTRIAAAWHHHTWWPSVVSVSDRAGQLVGRFVNAGWIQHLNLTADGRYLVAAGVSNAHGGAALAALEASRIGGVSPHADGSLPPCMNCPAGAPSAYVVIPWSDMARPPEGLSVSVQVADSGVIELRAAQRAAAPSGLPEIIVELSPDLEVLRRSVSDTFVQEHRRMERAGELTHPAERCPWLNPPVHVWTGAEGWRTTPPTAGPPGKARELP